MKKIYQKHETGCVPACIAMLANLSYDQTVKLIHPKRKGKRKGTCIGKILKTLDKLQIPYRIRPKKNFTQIKNPCILIASLDPLSKTTIYTDDLFPYVESGSHAILWTGKKIFDPYANRPKYTPLYKRKALNRTFFTIEILQ